MAGFWHHPDLIRSGAFAQWYTHRLFANRRLVEADLECPERMNVYGNYLAGVPFAVVGHNRFCAWGFNMFWKWWCGLIREKINPAVRTNSFSKINMNQASNAKWNIHVKGGKDINFTIKRNTSRPQSLTKRWNIGIRMINHVRDLHSFFPHKHCRATYVFSHASNMQQI